MIDNNNIEQLIKQKLNNFETEVSADVWDKIDSQLDQLQPANNPGAGSDAIVQSAGTNVTAWVAGIGAAVVGAATIGVLFFGNTNDSSEVVADKMEILTPQPKGNEIVTASESESDFTNSNEEATPNQLEEKNLTGSVIEDVESNATNTAIIAKEIVEEADEFDRDGSLISTHESRSDISASAEPQETISSETESTSNDVVTPANTVIENKVDAPTVNQEVEVVTEELIEQKIEEQEALNKKQSGIGQIPNVFTPNGDGINDHFLFATENIAEIRVNIYSARGELIFVISGNDKWHWDGDLRTGQSAAEGSYYYAIYATGFDGVKHQRKGTLYLNR